MPSLKPLPPHSQHLFGHSRPAVWNDAAFVATPSTARGPYRRRMQPAGLRHGGLDGFSKLEQVLQDGTPAVAALHAIRWWNLLGLGAVLRGVWRSLVHASALPDPPPAIRTAEAGKNTASKPTICAMEGLCGQTTLTTR